MARNDVGPVARLAARLGVEGYRIADHRLIPRELVLRSADRLGLDEAVNPNWTAQENLVEIFEATGSLGGLATLGDLDSSAEALIALLDAVPEPPAPKPLRPGPWAGPWSEPRAADAPRATSKIEAVNRISELTGSGPETLGPGSKERRSVFENLHRGLGFGEAPAALSKPELAREILERLGGTWDSTCSSSGYTVTLEGLNRLLARGAGHVDRLTGPRAEAEALAAHIAGILGSRPFWDGRLAIGWMLEAGYRHARQTEWPGWFFEFLTLDSLVEAFGGGPHPVPPVTFDYRARHTWDLKVHAAGAGDALPLNDQRAIRNVISEHSGLGLIVLTGHARFDDEHEFWTWHKRIRTGRTLFDSPPARRAGSRRLKTAFEPVRLQFYWLDEDTLASHPALTEFRQGRQADGSAREPKFHLDLARAADLVLAEHQFVV